MNIKGQLGELRMTVQITRKETGKVEEVELTSRITDQKTHEQCLKEISNGGDSLNSK